ncbi:MAG: Ig-like domain-containing protein [Muribaculaceae bacterium]|nr:Ig-like domain-containing protein [Muribaculaceae bacterium]
MVTALKPGTVTITVSTSNGKTAKCEITVVAKVIYVSSVTLDKTEIEAVTGDEFTLVATVLPEDATDKTLLWSSSDEAIASVDQTGKVTINGIGSAVITAHTTDGSEIKAECRIFGTSLVDAIENGGLKVDVYTVNGLLIKSDAGSRTISDLVKGTYIIRVGEKAHKIVK